MMETKEKAEELIGIFQGRIKEYPAEIYHDDIENQTAKQCALICVDEILNNSTHIMIINSNRSELICNEKYWKQVKKEIEKL